MVRDRDADPDDPASWWLARSRCAPDAVVTDVGEREVAVGGRSTRALADAGAVRALRPGPPDGWERTIRTRPRVGLHRRRHRLGADAHQRSPSPAMVERLEGVGAARSAPVPVRMDPDASRPTRRVRQPPSAGRVDGADERGRHRGGRRTRDPAVGRRGLPRSHQARRPPTPPCGATSCCRTARRSARRDRPLRRAAAGDPRSRSWVSEATTSRRPSTEAKSARLRLAAKPKVRAGVAVLQVELPDRPGALAHLTAALGEGEVNIEDLQIVALTGGRSRHGAPDRGGRRQRVGRPRCWRRRFRPASGWPEDRHARAGDPWRPRSKGRVRVPGRQVDRASVVDPRRDGSKDAALWSTFRVPSMFARPLRALAVAQPQGSTCTPRVGFERCRRGRGSRFHVEREGSRIGRNAT